MTNKTKVSTIIVICLVIVVFVINVSWVIYDYHFEKSVQLEKERSKEFLQLALETKNISFCKQTKWESGCIVLVGQKYQDIAVCGSPELDLNNTDRMQTFCQIAVLNNKSMCYEMESGLQNLCAGYVSTRNKPNQVFN